LFAALCVCVGKIISFPWFSKELKNDLSKNNWLRGGILILLVRESIFDGWGFSFSIVLVPMYKLSLCHTPIKPDLLGFPGIEVFARGLLDRMIKRFASLFKNSCNQNFSSHWWIFFLNFLVLTCENDSCIFQFLNELNLTYRRLTGFKMSFYFILIVLVSWGRFSLCHTPIRPFLAFRNQISILIVGVCDHVITRFASHMFTNPCVLRNPCTDWNS
jgi:hypothetical protein